LKFEIFIKICYNNWRVCVFLFFFIIIIIIAIELVWTGHHVVCFATSRELTE